MIAMTKSAASETPVLKTDLNVGLEQDKHLDFALPAHDDHHGKSVGHRWQRWRK